MRFSQEFIERVQESNNVVDIISQYTQLKHTGSGLMGRCPFPDHQEKTASFSVSETKQVYHCFGCHKSGNIFSFLRDYQGLNFPEAVEYLAHRANLILPSVDAAQSNEEDKAKERRKQLFKANKLAANFFNELMKKASDDHTVKKYIEKRGLTPETLEAFQVGYAPKEWDALTLYLQNNGIPTAVAEEARLLVPRKEGKSGHFDMFRDRLMFPILNSMSEVLAFGGRIIEQGEPKYLNSPETPVFIKGRVLYGLHQTARYIRSEDQALIVEGYMDLVSLYQAGIRNVAATLGTALTLDHAKILKRLTRNVLVLFDGDQAGQDAAERSLPLLLQADLYPKGLILPQGMDPDDYVKNYGAEALKVLIAEAPDLFSVVLKSWMVSFKGEPADKIKLIDKVKPILSAIPDYRLKDLYIAELATRAGLSAQWLHQALSLSKNSAPQRVPTGVSVKIPAENITSGTDSAAGLIGKLVEGDEKISLKKVGAAEITMMSLALKSRANFENFLSESMMDFILSDSVKGILQRADSLYRQEPEKFDRLTSLLVSFVDQPEKLFPSESLLLEQVSAGDGDVEEKVLKDAMKKVKETFLRNKLKGVTEELRAQPTSEKMEQIMNIQKDLAALNKDQHRDK